MEEISLADAVRRGIPRVRDPQWSPRDAYLKIDIILAEEGQGPNNYHGPWVRLYSPSEQKAIGVPTPQELLCVAFDWNEQGWQIYDGQKADGDEQDFIVVRRH